MFLCETRKNSYPGREGKDQLLLKFWEFRAYRKPVSFIKRETSKIFTPVQVLRRLMAYIFTNIEISTNSLEIAMLAIGVVLLVFSAQLHYLTWGFEVLGLFFIIIVTGVFLFRGERERNKSNRKE
jgi:hypothetical protein